MTRGRLIAASIAAGGVTIGVLLNVPPQAAVESQYLLAAVERGDLRTTVTATGTVNAVVTVKVGSQLSGKISDLLVDFNDEVRQGQAVARLDAQTFEARVREAEAALEVAQAQAQIQEAALKRAHADLANAQGIVAVVEANLASAKAKLDNASREFDRKESLLERQTIAASEVDRALAEHESAAALFRAARAEAQVQDAAILAAQASLEMAEADLRHARAVVKQRTAALEQAEVELARTVIRAPIDGVVVGRDVDRGQTVAASLEAPTLFTIAGDLREMEVHARIDEADIGRIQIGQRAAFKVDAYPDRTLEGTVMQIRKAPQVVQNVVTYTVLISAENQQSLLLPGMTAMVEIAVEEAVHVLKLPNAALRFRPPEQAPVARTRRPGIAAVTEGTPAVVWIPGDGDAPQPITVGIGVSDAAASELVAGPLGEGDQVVVGSSTPAKTRASFLGLRFGS